MKKLNVVQFGMRHEHAYGKILTLKQMTDRINLLGVVDEGESATPAFYSPFNPFEGIPRLTEDEVFSRKDIDMVVVEVPNLELVSIGMKCAEHNIPMHLDKPAGEELEPYAKLLDCCKAKNLPLQMGYMFRGNPVFKYLADIVREGVLGDLYEVEIDMNHDYSNPAYYDYLSKFKGGVMFNLGCHLIDYIVTLLGEQPERIESFLQSTPAVRQGIWNNTLAVLQYKHATAVIRICCPATCFVHKRHMRLAGTNGYAEFCPLERFDGKSLELTIELKKACGGLPAGKTVMTFPPVLDRYMDQFDELIDIVQGRKPNPDLYRHDYDVHKITLAAAQYIPWNP